MYPNPAQNYVWLNLNNNAPFVDLKITNVLGSIVLTQKVKNTMQPVFVTLDNLADGMYFLQVNDGQQGQLKQFVLKH